jgi:D-lactate dehydrogenase
MTTVAVYDAKAYDRVSLTAAAGAESIDWRFFEFRLTPDSVLAAAEAQAVCIFVNDRADRAVLEKLAELHVQLLALRCTGFNHVDIQAAKELGITVTRVPVYSPYAVAEHVVALLLALNRKIHRAYNRVRELNFSLSGLVGFDLYGKTAGIIGTGKIGRITAQILRGFGMRVLAYDPFPSPDWAEQYGIEYVECRTLAC